MRFALFIARRYLHKGGKHSFISTISWVSALGITIGVAALVIALALINGFQGDLRNKLLDATAHVMVSQGFGDGIEAYGTLAERIQTENPETVKSVSPVVYGTVLLKGQGRQSGGAILRGIQLDNEESAPWQKQLTQGKLPMQENEMMVGQDLAGRLGIFPGDSCTVIIPTPVLTPGGYLPKIKRLQVSGVYKSGIYEVDNTTLMMTLSAAQSLFRMQSRVHYLRLYLFDINRAEELAQKLRNDLDPSLSVITWKDLNSSLYSALDLEKTVLFFTLTLIIIVASLNIVAGLILLVYEKRKDIGILSSCGAPIKVIRQIFFLQGGIIGLIGTMSGVTLGSLFCLAANRFELIKVPAEIYQMSHIPFRIVAGDMLAIIIASLIICLTATLFPSRRAARINVIEAIKNE